MATSYTHYHSFVGTCSLYQMHNNSAQLWVLLGTALPCTDSAAIQYTTAVTGGLLCPIYSAEEMSKAD